MDTWIATDNGFCTNASDAGINVGAAPSVSTIRRSDGLPENIRNRLHTCIWAAVRDEEDEITHWNAVINGVFLTIFND